METNANQSVTITAKLLTAASVDELLKRIEGADEVSFQLDYSFSADLLKTLMLVAALSRRERRVNVYFAETGPSDGVQESLAHSLLGPMLGHITQSQEGLHSRDVGFRRRGYVDHERRLFCVPTAGLDCESREGFLNDLSTWMRAAKIVLPQPVLQRVAALAFEPNQNAEEHGSVRTGESSEVFRCFAARVHDRPGPELSESAHGYLRAYHAQGHAIRTRWLEIVVVDAGMGLSYPRFFVRAQAMNSRILDIYRAGWEAEHGVFTEMLCRARSTKGYWGSSRSEQTTTGQGHRLILRNVLQLRGYAAVRAGRCQGSIVRSESGADSIAGGKQGGYQIDEKEYELFGGTAWHLLVPLDQQLTLAL